MHRDPRPAAWTADLHPRRPGRHLGLDSSDEFVWGDGGVHAREVPVRRGEESASGGDDGTPSPRRAGEFKGGLAAPYSVSARNGPCSSLATVGWACASTSPASAYLPGGLPVLQSGR